MQRSYSSVIPHRQHHTVFGFYDVYSIEIVQLELVRLDCTFKGPFHDPQAHPPIFFKKIKFLHQQKPFACAKYFLQVELFGDIIGHIVY